MRRPLSRRTLLRGAGVAMALPALEVMTPVARAARRAPLRLAFLYVPNGVQVGDWRPKKVGPNFELPPTLAPLTPLRDQVTVLSGLEQANARPLGDGPGDHARALACFLTGVHPTKTNGANISVGPSADQVAAASIGHLTRLPSLELGCDRGAQSGNCDSGYSCAYSSNLSWKAASLPMAKEINPALVFDRMFATGVDPKRDREKRALLDFVGEELASLTPRLGPTDRRKLDEYLTGVRELEERIGRFASPTSGPALVSDLDRPDGPPKDPEEHIRLMCDLMVVAFQSDITRVATFLIANAGSNRSYPTLDVAEGHHDLSHHGGNPEKLEKIARINRFHVTQLAYFLEKMRAAKEGGGSLLDHSMVVYGSGIADGDKHDHDDLPVLLAGRGGGSLRPGRHLRYPKKPLCNLFLSLLDRMKVPVERLGDSTGRLDGLG